MTSDVPDRSPHTPAVDALGSTLAAPADQAGGDQSLAPRTAAGSFLQHYEIIRPLGRGGMGAVFLARDTRLGRLVALKLLLKHSGEGAQRFLIEARATAQISHENIVVIHELGQFEGTPYIVLEYLRGKTLDELIRERRERLPEASEAAGPGARAPAAMPPDRAVELMIPVARALACAHENGVTHRDLKPSNIMMSDTGVVKVLDFGIAKVLGAPDAGAEGDLLLDQAARAASMTRSALTEAGLLIGTPAYMAPEQWRAGPVDHRADIWAVGLILAELVLGRHPLEPLSPRVLMSIARLDEPMPSLRELCPEIGKLASVIDRCLLKNSEDRLGSVSELLTELEGIAAVSRPSSQDRERCPYAGLSPFQPGDAPRFFGRTAAIAEVIAQLADQPLLAIVGPSGAGKSSFVRAGVIPALNHSGDAWEAFTVRPGARPLSALSELLTADALRTSSQPTAMAGDPADADRASLAEKLYAEPGLLGARLRAFSRRKLKRALLFVDQMEELYTLAPEADRAAFFACLAGVADDVGSPLRVVVSIRSDFLERVAEARAALAALRRGILLLPPMDRAGLREALVRPLEATGYRFETPELIEEMLDALEHATSALPLLSFTAAKLWERRDRAARTLTEASYRNIGGVTGTLASHADAVLGAMSAEERKLARTALSRLVTPERTRAICTFRELCELSPSPAAMESVLGRLIDARLLTAEGGREADATVEIVHESLIAGWPALSGWVTESREDAAFVARLRHAAREWEASGRSEDLLWRGQAADDVKRWRARYAGALAASEDRYLNAVISRSARARRLLLWVVASVIGSLAAIAVVVSYLAVRADRAAARAREEAERAAQEAARAQAEARRARNATRMASARELFADPTTALALLREVEPPDMPRGWSELSYWALHSRVAAVVVTHAEGVARAAWSPDGERIITAGYDKTARIFRADGRGDPVVLRGHDDAIYSAAWSLDGARIVTASLDKTARVWRADGQGGSVVLRGHSDVVHAAAFSPSGARVVTASGDGTARVWRADGQGDPVVLRGHDDALYTAAFSPDGERIVTASRDKTARIFRADGRGDPLILRGHTDRLYAAAFGPDGARIVTASNDATARVWRADGEGDPLVLRGHGERLYWAAWSPDGERIVTAGNDKTARVWRADGKGDPLILPHADGVYWAAWDLDGERISTASWDRTARSWSMVARGAPLVLRGHEGAVLSAAFRPDGARIVTASADSTARVWRADGSGEPVVLRGHEGGLFGAAWSPDGERIVTASKDKTARVWRADGAGKPVVLRGHERDVHSAVWSPDGARIVTASQDETARVWRADGAGEPVVLRGHTSAVYWASFSPDGRLIATASRDKTARVWRADGSGEPLVLRGHESDVYSAAFSPDGARIVTASRDKTVRVWSRDGAGDPRILRGHEHWVNSAMWSPDGGSLISASQDRTVRVWSADGTGDPLVLRGAEEAYNWAALSPDGESIAAASEDKTVWVWTDVEPLQRADDPKLWAATTYCMPVDRRIKILNVPEAAARADEEACLRRVFEARGAP